MVSKADISPVLRLLVLSLLMIGTIASFGGVPQNLASFDRMPLSPVLYYFAYFAAAGIILLLFWWFSSMVYHGRIIFRRTPLDIPILLFLIYCGLRIIFAKAPYLVSTELFRLLVLAGFFYFAVNNVSSKGHVKLVIFLLIAAGFAISVYGLINTAYLGNDTLFTLHRPFEYKGRVGGTFICPNHFAGFLEILIPFALSYVVISRIRPSAKALLGLAGLVLIAAMVFTESRGGWAAVFVGMVTVVLVSIRKVKLPLAAVITPAIVTTALLVALVWTQPTVTDRVTGSFKEEDKSVTSRRDVWIDTFAMIKDNPLFGRGPGTYRYTFTQYQRSGFYADVDRAHNDYLHTLAEYGIIGFGLIAAMIIITAKVSGVMMDTLQDRDDFAFVSGYMGAFVAIAVHSFVDFNMHIPANAILMITLTGMVFGVRHYSLGLGREIEILDIRPMMSRARPFALGAIILAMLLAFIGLFSVGRRYLGAYYHHLGLQEDISVLVPIAREQEIPEEIKEDVVENYLKARYFDPRNPAHAGALENIYLRQGESNFSFKSKLELMLKLDLTTTLERIRKAVELGEEAVSGNPYNAEYHLALAKAYHILMTFAKVAETGMVPDLEDKDLETPETYRELAGKHYREAVEVFPNRLYYGEALAEFYLKTRKIEEARQAALRTMDVIGDKRPQFYKRTIAVLLSVAQEYINRNELAEARELIRRVEPHLTGPHVRVERDKAEKLLKLIEEKQPEGPGRDGSENGPEPEAEL